MAKTYFLRFGFGDPRSYSGLAPTLLQFTQYDGTAITPPAVTENYNVSGGVTTGTGIYKFTWNPTLPISFLADAATTSPGSDGRYVVGSLDPVDAINEQLTNASFAVNSPAIGTTASSFGSDVSDPVDIFGYMKRILENLEGNQTFNKTSGAFAISTRGSTLLATKTVVNSVTMVTRS